MTELINANEENRVCINDSECIVDEVCLTLSWIYSDVNHEDYSPEIDNLF